MKTRLIKQMMEEEEKKGRDERKRRENMGIWERGSLVVGSFLGLGEKIKKKMGEN